MIYYPNRVPMTDRLQEIVSSREQDFPYVAMEADLGLYAGGGTPWHWHDFFEVAVVDSGCLELLTQTGSVRLKPGEGYFVNANVLHQCRAGDDAGCVMHTQLFSRELLTGAGLIGRKYVSPVENCVALELLLFREADDGCGELLRVMNAAFDAAKQDKAGYELAVNRCLMRLWELLHGLAEPKLRTENPPAREDSVRTKRMLSFIHGHYAEPIAVKDIADAAGICERECYRCFAKVLDTTPQTYLTRHRINAAARALAETEGSVAQIAIDCGFSSASYFGKVFRSALGCSPAQFRKEK